MPTNTFLHLPEEKRRRLLCAAAQAFAQRPYGEVCLSGIIQAAGIPRGSFYQYFADKTDLFQYLLCQIGRRMRELTSESLDRCGGQLLDLPLALFDRAMEYLREDEEEARIILCIMRHNPSVGRGQIWDVEAAVKALLERADLSHLALDGRGEVHALLDLLLSATGQAVGAACCDSARSGLYRAHLEHEVALIRRGVMRTERDEEACPC